jgi:molybdopterin-guanine dinucleotide biosynthesis protein A
MPPAATARSPAIAGAVVAGGVGRRFGSDKALASIGGVRMLDHAWEALAPFSPRWVIAGSQARTQHLRQALADTPMAHALVPDDQQGLGPMGGVATALRLARDANAAAVAVLAVDLPHLTRDYWDWLLAHAAATTGSTTLERAWVPRDHSGRWHPLAGVYPTSLHAAAHAATLRGHASLQKFLNEVDAHAVALPESMRAMLHNVNTPEDARA